MKYSIIIPHKNAPDLLRRCLASIPNRTDIEIIIVDDNSSAEKVDFSHFPGTERKNTHIIYIKEGESKGAGNARNIALPLAKGEFIIFADCDDFFNDCFNDILTDYKNTNYDVIYFNANSVDSITYKPSFRVDHLHEFYDIYNTNKALGILYFRYMFTEPWCKIIKTSLIKENNIHFDSTCVNNDVLFSNEIGGYAKNIAIDKRKGYCVTSREGSLCQTDTPEAHSARFYVHAKWNKFLIDRNINISIPRFEYMLYTMSQLLYKSPSLYIKKYKILKDCGYSHYYIIKETIRNICTTIKLKYRKIKEGF